MKRNAKNYLLILGQIVLGDIIYALAVVMFVVPNGLITGGTTGLALFFFHTFGIPVSLYVTVSNYAMFILGTAILGKKFAISTVAGTVIYPFILMVLEAIPIDWKMTDDPMLAVVCTGVMFGVGFGLILRTDASSGGLDVIPLVLKKKAGISMAVTMNIMDVAILLLQMVISNREAIIYGILLVMGYTIIMDKVLLMGRSLVRAEIVTSDHEEMTSAIQGKLERGVTLISGRTGYLHKDCMVVMTVLSSRELSKLKNLVREVDPTAFMMVERISEVQGGRRLYQ